MCDPENVPFLLLFNKKGSESRGFRLGGSALEPTWARFGNVMIVQDLDIIIAFSSNANEAAKKKKRSKK